MKILLNECVTKKLKQYLNEFEIFTVNELNWSGVKNGKLMSLCIRHNFDILLTIDKNLMFQQNLDKYNITIVVLNCRTSKIEELITFISSFKAQINTLQKFKAYIINKEE